MSGELRLEKRILKCGEGAYVSELKHSYTKFVEKGNYSYKILSYNIRQGQLR
jgi:hypothetical protein